jgi:plasmid stability protein
MAAVTIRKLPESTHRALKQRARDHGTSTEAEIRAILIQAVQPEADTLPGLGTLLYQIGQSVGGVELDITRDPTPIEPADFG